jgi:hypothetical protein
MNTQSLMHKNNFHSTSYTVSLLSFPHLSPSRWKGRGVHPTVEDECQLWERVSQSNAIKGNQRKSKKENHEPYQSVAYAVLIAEG